MKEYPITHEKVSHYFERTIAHLENLMVVVCDFTLEPKKSPEPPHSHPHEQITFVAEGELLFIKGGNEFHLFKGDIITIPSGVPHCIRLISNSVRLIDCFQPLRNDFLEKK